MRLAVVGHAEWVTFASVERLPRPGEIVHAAETWREPGGGGGIVAVLLAAMAGSCEFLTAAAEGDGLAGALRDRGVTVHTPPVAESRRIFCHLDGAGERAITVLGARLDPAGDDGRLPWDSLEGADAVFVTAGDAAAVRAARRARVLVATPRAGEALGAAEVDVLVWSAEDPAEEAAAARLPRPGVAVRTRGAAGGEWTMALGATGRWDAAGVPGPAVDAFGCGDAFAAALTYGLGAGWPLEAAVGLGARCGAATLAARGPYGAVDALATLASSGPSRRTG